MPGSMREAGHNPGHAAPTADVGRRAKGGDTMYIYYRNYKGGTNNLIVVTDINGITGTSTISKKRAIANYKRQLLKWTEAKQIAE